MSPWQLFCQQVRFICRKELLAIWKDKAFRYVLVIPTLVLGVVFGYTATFNVENVTYAVLDQSHSEASTSLLATLDGTRFFQRVADLQNTAQIQEPIDQENVMVVLSIPEEFEEKREEILRCGKELLNVTGAEMAAAYELLPLKRFKGILDNIVYLGLNASMERVLNPKKTASSAGDPVPPSAVSLT